MRQRRAPRPRDLKHQPLAVGRPGGALLDTGMIRHLARFTPIRRDHPKSPRYRFRYEVKAISVPSGDHHTLVIPVLGLKSVRPGGTSFRGHHPEIQRFRCGVTRKAISRPSGDHLASPITRGIRRQLGHSAPLGGEHPDIPTSLNGRSSTRSLRPSGEMSLRTQVYAWPMVICSASAQLAGRSRRMGTRHTFRHQPALGVSELRPVGRKGRPSHSDTNGQELRSTLPALPPRGAVARDPYSRRGSRRKRAGVHPRTSSGSSRASSCR